MIPFIAIAAAIGFIRFDRKIAISLLGISMIWNLAGVRIVAKKSMPAVAAARSLQVHSVVVSQQWAYGDRLYFTDRVAVGDVGEPPRQADLDRALATADAACFYETDLDQPWILTTLKQRGFAPWRTFRDGPAKAVVVFTRSVSDTSDRARR